MIIKDIHHGDNKVIMFFENFEQIIVSGGHSVNEGEWSWRKDYIQITTPAHVRPEFSYEEGETLYWLADHQKFKKTVKV